MYRTVTVVAGRQHPAQNTMIQQSVVDILNISVLSQPV